MADHHDHSSRVLAWGLLRICWGPTHSSEIHRRQQDDGSLGGKGPLVEAL